MLKYIVLSLHDSLKKSIIAHNFPYHILSFRDDNLASFPSSECIAIVDTDSSLNYLSSKRIAMPSIGILNSPYPDQQLYGASYLAEYADVIDESFLALVYNRFHQLPMTIGETKRTIIRELTPEDCDALYDLYDSIGPNPDVKPLPFDRNEARITMKRYQENGYGFYGYGLWGIFYKENNRLVGYCGVEQNIRHGDTCFELSYMIHKDYQQKSIGYEVCETIIEIARDVYEFPHIALFTSKNNTASIHLATKLGFRRLPFLPKEHVSFIMDLSQKRKD